jgi:uncharacterized membrane protein YeiH
MVPVKAFQLPPFFDYGATFVWAVSGALLAARRGYAILGILTLALVSSTGGGLLRDGIFIDNGPPGLVQTPIYLWLIIIAAVLVILLGRRIERLPHAPSALLLTDALGLGAYATVGMDRALAAGISLPGVMLVGMVNAVGGGMLRDVLLNNEQQMFKPGTLEQALALLGCIVFILLTQALHSSVLAAAWVTILTVFISRLLAIRFRIQTHPLSDFRSYWDRTGEKDPD